ncbi:Asparagine synthetase domain-containing protein [Mycena sanguinolenta]|uniref:Asparagine synthetase domain-containing protein n=1 Tax=Mycena sanguinolenta TaxID=230812 RepID=A0A8H7CVN2_9AGAR|nr:Asparagine synthetase domain-containing protein [Mycena sanguinolenta]
MCGLTAVYYPEATTRPDSSGIGELLSNSLAKIQHRGPDYTGVWVASDCSVGLGHVRLSIIDLEHGQQPLSDEDEHIHCVVTGEIYDHERIRDELMSQGFTFKTKSDSELVVQLYKRDGIDLLPSLRGEFAFVLYDSTRRLMLAARDRFGIKPLYYTISDGRLLIASEMKAFLAFGWKAKWDIDSVVHNGDFSDDRTIFKGVNKLMAGHSLVFRPTGYLKVQSYWDITYSNTDAPNAATVDEMISNVRTHLFDAIRLRLRSDVPVGVYLSGGIDSAAVAGMAIHLLRQKNPNAKLATFTLAFPDAGDNDEGPIAHRTATFLGAEEHMVNVTEKELVDAFEATLWHAEQPLWSLLAPGKYLLSNFVRNQGYKVVLSGEGADEFLGGYAWLPVDYLRRSDPPGLAMGLELPSDAEREAILNRIQMATVPVLSLSKNSYTDAPLARKMLGGISAHRAYAAAGSAGAELYNPRAIAVAGVPDVPRAIAEGINPSIRKKAVSGKWHPLNIASYVSAKTILMQAILNHMGERMEMSHSVEGRPPFLDHNFVEYVNTIPPSLKVRPVKNETSGTWAFTEKWILRQAVKPYVTEEVFLRRKLSYNAPPSRRREGESILVPLQAHLKARITRTNVERVGFLEWSLVEDSLTGYLTNPNFPADGSLDARAQLLLYVLSFIVLQEKFDVPTWDN